MRPATVILALLLAALAALCAARSAVAAPVPESPAKRKLEALKKRMPEVLDTWAKEHDFAVGELADDGTGWQDGIPVLKRVRLLSDNKARLTIHLHYKNKKSGVIRPKPTHLLNVFLTYHDGVWTAIRFEWATSRWRDPETGLNKAAQFLLDAIDEAAEKK